MTVPGVKFDNYFTTLHEDDVEDLGFGVIKNENFVYGSPATNLWTSLTELPSTASFMLIKATFESVATASEFMGTGN